MLEALFLPAVGLGFCFVSVLSDWESPRAMDESRLDDLECRLGGFVSSLGVLAPSLFGDEVLKSYGSVIVCVFLATDGQAGIDSGSMTVRI